MICLVIFLLAFFLFFFFFFFCLNLVELVFIYSKATVNLFVNNSNLSLFIPHHTTVAGYYGFTLDVHASVHPSVHFSFLDDNLTKHQWIFTKLGMCIDIVEIWFGIANGQISSNFTDYLPETRPYFRFRLITCVNNKRF